MSSMLPTPNACCNCGTPLNITTLENYIQNNVTNLEALGLVYVDTIVDLRAWGTSDGNRLALVRGWTLATDGLSSAWDWDDTATDADDGANVIRPDDYDGSRGGVWKRQAIG